MNLVTSWEAKSESAPCGFLSFGLWAYGFTFPSEPNAIPAGGSEGNLGCLEKAAVPGGMPTPPERSRLRAAFWLPWCTDPGVTYVVMLYITRRKGLCWCNQGTNPLRSREGEYAGYLGEPNRVTGALTQRRKQRDVKQEKDLMCVVGLETEGATWDDTNTTFLEASFIHATPHLRVCFQEIQAKIPSLFTFF